MTAEKMMLRDALDIPKRVDSSDFVLQLNAGVAHAGRTLSEYVVTDSLATSFDDALGLIESTIGDQQSKGAFVHGSFGSGKSHFLAVLHLLLTGNTQARALPNLQATIADHQRLLGRRVLAVDYHLLGAESFESALFDGYRSTVARLHPDAPAPVLHKSDSLLDDARSLREAMGDGTFFAALGGEHGGDGWGDLATGWDAESFDAAAAMPYAPGNERERLVRALTSTLMTSYTGSGEWLDISTGLESMTAHARSLEYDAVVLFLDELVLWLAQHLSDTAFIQNETSKVAKLVESGLGNLPLPLVSFVARQRDLKDFLGGAAIGAEREALGQSFQWWEDRFERIDLAAADLPRIVHQRLLQPTSDAGRDAITRAVADVKANPGAWRHMLSDETGAGEVDFEQVYPFSPALVDALIALSSLMQRERTALKIMGELLSHGREVLRVSDVIPVGDLFDEVVAGASPQGADVRKVFEFADRFYRQRMRPHLLDKHRLDESATADLNRAHPFRNEDRLAKTLLVAAIAPAAVSLRNLTADKLAALNFGTVKSFVPGQEADTVLNQVKEWALEFGEISIGEGPNPVLSIQLAGVDYDSVIERVQNEDTSTARRKLVSRLIREALGVAEPQGLIAEQTHSMIWRGGKRNVDIVFANIRDEQNVADETFRANGDRWRVVIDYPFDEPSRSRVEDFNRLDQLRQADYLEQTIAWVPHFLTSERMTDIGQLVVLDYLLTGTRFDDNASSLPVAEREPARRALENKRRNLLDKIRTVLHEAYGVTTAQPADVELTEQAKVFDSLYDDLRIAPPVAADLRGALDAVISQAYAQVHPDHPRFEPSEREVRKAELTTVWTIAQEAHGAGGRVEGVDRNRAETLRRVCNPLGCGQARENVYSLAPDTFGWRQRFVQWATDDSEPDKSVQISRLRSRLSGYGMTREVEDLLILCWSLVADREWTRAGARLGTPPGIGQVTDDMRLTVPTLPDEREWEIAGARAGHLFGVTPDRAVGVRSVARLAQAVRGRADETQNGTAALVHMLEEHAQMLGLDIEAASGRLDTARRANRLDIALATAADDTQLVKALAAADVPDEPQAIARCRTSAATLARTLESASWEVLDSLDTVADDRARTIRTELADVANADELHQPLRPAIDHAQQSALRILMENRTHEPPPDDSPERSDHNRSDTTRLDAIDLKIDDAGGLDDAVAQLRDFHAKHPDRRVHVRWWVE